MFRAVFLTFCLLAVSVDGSVAQQTRDRLDGFNGVSFGTTYTEAKQFLGAMAKEGNKTTTAKNKIRLLSIDTTIDGQLYAVVYFFGSDDRLSRVNIAPKPSTTAKDRETCRAAGASMVQSLVEKYGAATTDKTDGDERNVIFKFRDGNVVEAALFGPLGCIIFGFFYTPAGKDH